MASATESVRAASAAGVTAFRTRDGDIRGRLEHDRHGSPDDVGLHRLLCRQQPVDARPLGDRRTARALRCAHAVRAVGRPTASGADYLFLSKTYGPLAAFLSGWVSFLIGFGGPIAAASAAAANYLLAPLRLGDATATFAQPAVASVAIVVMGVVHCLGRGSTIRAQAGMTGLKIGILASLAVAGLAGSWGRWENISDRPSLSSGLVVTMASSLVYISYAYTGSIFSMLTVSAVYVLRWRQPDLPRPFGHPAIRSCRPSTSPGPAC